MGGDQLIFCLHWQSADGIFVWLVELDEDSSWDTELVIFILVPVLLWLLLILQSRSSFFCFSSHLAHVILKLFAHLLYQLFIHTFSCLCLDASHPKTRARTYTHTRLEHDTISAVMKGKHCIHVKVGGNVNKNTNWRRKIGNISVRWVFWMEADRAKGQLTHKHRQRNFYIFHRLSTVYF